jgi:hypothetical protein
MTYFQTQILTQGKDRFWSLGFLYGEGDLVDYFIVLVRESDRVEEFFRFSAGVGIPLLMSRYKTDRK